MRKNILIMCSSSYQILVAMRIIEEKYKEDNIDILITDTIAQSDSLYERMKRETVFSNVYLWKVKGKIDFSKKQLLRDAISGYKRSFVLVSDCECRNKSYDVFLYASLSLFAMHLGNVLLHNNKKLKIEMFEDGFSTYSAYTGAFFNNINFKRRFLRKLFFKTSALYVFNPEIMSWKPQFDLYKICPEFKGACLETINRVFDYYSLKDNYEASVIFFEESYAADGRKIDDVELVESIAEYVGKDNIFVKIHPRNPTNRFSKRGYRTNSNISIPWEVILINKSFDHTVFVTLASNAAMNPFFLFQKKTPSFLLFNCTSTPDALYKQIIEYDKKLCSEHSDVFYIPQNQEQLKEQLINILGKV